MTVIQLAIYVASGSVALLADLVHNFGDALTAVPLGIAFLLRSARGERIAGLVEKISEAQRHRGPDGRVSASRRRLMLAPMKFRTVAFFWSPGFCAMPFSA